MVCMSPGAESDMRMSMVSFSSQSHGTWASAAGVHMRDEASAFLRTMPR